MMGVSEEELYNLPTAEYVNRRGAFLNRQLTVYHVALHGCADLRNVEVLADIFDYVLISDVKPSFELCWVSVCSSVLTKTIVI